MPDQHDPNSLGAFALLYSLPFGISLAVSAVTSRATALTTAAAVAGSALVAWSTDTIMTTDSPATGFGVSLLGALVVAAARHAADSHHRNAHLPSLAHQAIEHGAA
jgi:hypothetical protein